MAAPRRTHTAPTPTPHLTQTSPTPTPHRPHTTHRPTPKINRVHSCCFLAAAVACACTLIVVNVPGTDARVGALSVMIVLWVVAAALALRVDHCLFGHKGTKGVLPVFGFAAAGAGAGATAGAGAGAVAAEADLEDDGDQTVWGRINKKMETAHEVFDEYSGEFVGNGDIAEWGAKGLKMVTK